MCRPDSLWFQRSARSESLLSSSWKKTRPQSCSIFIQPINNLPLLLSNAIISSVSMRLLPSIPWGHFLHSNSFKLADQLLTASAYRLSEFREGATALQSVLRGAAVLHAGPAGVAVAWRTDGRTDRRPLYCFTVYFTTEAGRRGNRQPGA